MNDILISLYARVSSEQQVKKGTIDSQVEALNTRILSDGYTINKDMLFIDDGVSGATLVRPALERLRDCAGIGHLEKLYVLSPDRLARKYAHQALLMEELQSNGVDVIFLNHNISNSPEDNLLLQMQGMFAEYERAKIIERNRRGKLHSAKQGNVGVLSGAPYGYRYIRKQQNGAPAQYIIELSQAIIVRKIFNWICCDRMSIGQVVRQLGVEGILSATGKSYWDRSVIWGMLQNPAYVGRAAFGKTKSCSILPRVRPQRNSTDVPKRGYSTVRTQVEKQISIAVPAIISESLFQAAQEQLKENKTQARQRKKGATYLLQGLTVCGCCRYAYYGKKISRKAAKDREPYAYYRCVGTDAHRFGGKAVCNNKQVRTQQLDDCVWAQVKQLLSDPNRLKAEYNKRLKQLESKTNNNLDENRLKKFVKQIKTGKARLIDGYTDGLIDKKDFENRILDLKHQQIMAEQQLKEIKQESAGQLELVLLINRLEEFAEAVNNKLNSIDFLEKREVIRALVKRIEIYKNEVVVVFRVTPEPISDLEIQSENHSLKNQEQKIMQDCKRSHDSTLRRSYTCFIGYYFPSSV